MLTQKQLFDELDEDQKKAVPKERYEQIVADYNAVLPRVATGRDKTRPRNEWCKVSIYQRAKEAEQYWQEQMEAGEIKGNTISLYGTFYR